MTTDANAHRSKGKARAGWMTDRKLKTCQSISSETDMFDANMTKGGNAVSEQQAPTDSFPSPRRSSVIYLVGGDDLTKCRASTFPAPSDICSCRYGKFFENLSALGTNGAHQVHDDFTCGLRGGDSSVPRALAIFFSY